MSEGRTADERRMSGSGYPHLSARRGFVVVLVSEVVRNGEVNAEMKVTIAPQATVTF